MFALSESLLLIWGWRLGVNHVLILLCQPIGIVNRSICYTTPLIYIIIVWLKSCDERTLLYLLLCHVRYARLVIRVVARDQNWGCPCVDIQGRLWPLVVVVEGLRMGGLVGLIVLRLLVGMIWLIRKMSVILGLGLATGTDIIISINIRASNHRRGMQRVLSKVREII